jgi:flagellar biosynthesis/type III secretory pathway protein FliH
LIDWMMQLPPELENQFREEMTRLAEEKQMPYVTSLERLAREEGREEGRQEGLEEGVRKGLLEGIEVGLSVRFGPEGLALMTEVRRVQNVAQLQKLLALIRTVGSLDDYRQILRT